MATRACQRVRQHPWLKARIFRSQGCSLAPSCDNHMSAFHNDLRVLGINRVDFKILGFLGSGIWDSGILGFWKSGILESGILKSGIFESRILRFGYPWILSFWDSGVWHSGFWCLGFRTLGFWTSKFEVWYSGYLIKFFFRTEWQ